MKLVELARNPIPSGAVAGTFPGYDGKPMRYARWDATRGPRRGTICCFTGRGEYIEKYFETIADLRRRGFAAAIMDWRGQGGSFRPLSDPRKGHIRDFSEYDRDLAAFMREVVLPDCPPPYVALAHSMGGNILLRNASTQGVWFDRMVLSAPMLELSAAMVGKPQLPIRIMCASMCAVGLGRLYLPGQSSVAGDAEAFEGNPLTSDRGRFERNRMLEAAAPHLLVGGPTHGWLHAAYSSMAMLTAPSYAERVKVPLLLFVAGHDRIVSPRAIEDFASRLKVGSHVLLPTANHEILQETDAIRSRFWAAFDAYLGVDAPAA